MGFESHSFTECIATLIFQHFLRFVVGRNTAVCKGKKSISDRGIGLIVTGPCTEIYGAFIPFFQSTDSPLKSSDRFHLMIKLSVGLAFRAVCDNALDTQRNCKQKMA